MLGSHRNIIVTLRVCIIRKKDKAGSDRGCCLNADETWLCPMGSCWVHSLDRTVRAASLPWMALY